MICVVLLLCCAGFSICDQSVKYAAVIYRHGDRTPVNPYPTDPWKNQSWWPVYFGQLTNIGKRQHYALGVWLRNRYSHLLSNKYDPTEIYVRSTDVDRTLMSAQANLAGMYTPSGDSIWDPQLMWQPIPIHTVPEKDDEVLAMKKECLAYTNEYERYIHSKAYRDRLSKYQSLMDYLSAYTGMKVKDYYDIDDIYSTLYIESLYNFTLPTWTLTVYPNKLRNPACYSFVTQTGTPILARLKVGPLLKEISTRMAHVMTNTNQVGHHHAHNLTIYSGHDITIGSVLNALGLYDGNCPVYTSTILMELVFDNSTSKHYIRISYRNSTEIVEPYVLNIPYCGELCPMERFIKLYKNLLTVDWEFECKQQFPAVLAVAFFIGVGLFIIIYIAHKVHFIRVSRQYQLHSAYISIQSPTVMTTVMTVTTSNDNNNINLIEA